MASTQKVIGSPLQNLVLETAGRVYIKVAEHYYELDFRNKTVEEVESSEETEGTTSTPSNIDLSQYLNKSEINNLLVNYATKDDTGELASLIEQIQQFLENLTVESNPYYFIPIDYTAPSTQTKYEFINSLVDSTVVNPFITIIEHDVILPPVIIKHNDINAPFYYSPNLGIKYFSRWEVAGGEIQDEENGDYDLLPATEDLDYYTIIPEGSFVYGLHRGDTRYIYIVLPKYNYTEADLDESDNYIDRKGVYTKVGPRGHYYISERYLDFEDENNYYLLYGKIWLSRDGKSEELITYNYNHTVGNGDLNISQLKSNNYNILLDLDAGTLKLGNKLVYENGILEIDVPYFENRYQKSPTIPALTPTDLNPAGWSTSIPAYSEGDIIWMISCQRTKNALVTNWSGPIRITSPNIDTSVMRYIGRSTTTITDGGVEYPTINGQVITNLKLGDVVAYNAKEFVWIGSGWEEVGDENSYLPKSGGTITGDLTVNGVLESIGAMIIPDHAPANPTSGKNYLYSATGEYAEEPGGGGAANIYDLTLHRGSISVGPYNLGERAADIDLESLFNGYATQSWVNTQIGNIDFSSYALKTQIPTKVSDLENDTGFITSSALNGYVTLATDQHNITGSKSFTNRVNLASAYVTSYLSIPQIAPSVPLSGYAYLWSDTDGNYSEIPSGGGAANVYPFTLMRGSSVLGEYDVSLQAWNIDLMPLFAPYALTSSLSSYVNGGEYNSTTKKIYLKNGSTNIAEIDATAFIKDGMVSSVVIDNDYLVISFNTDAGQSPIRIALTDIFNPANYYTKTEIMTLLGNYVTLNTKQEITGEKYFSNALAIPLSAPSSPTAGRNYLYSGSGSYAEVPSGGGGGDVYPLTITKNGSAWLYYDPDERSVSVNLSVPTKVSDIANDTGFITSSALSGYVNALEQDSGNYVIGITKDGNKLSVSRGTLPTKLSDFTDDVVSGNYLPIHGTADKALRLSGDTAHTAWGQTFWQNGVPKTISGDISNAGNITGSGLITMPKAKFSSSLIIPHVAPSGTLESGEAYLYTGTGEYAEEPSGGGGVANIYDLTISKNSAEIGTYNLGTAAANVNILISWSDLVPDADHQFVTSSDITNWDTAFSQTHTHNNKLVLDGIDAGDITNWNTAYGWGDHSTQGYTNINQSIPYIVGSSSDTTGYWTGSYTGITAYTDGLTVIYVPGKAGRSGGSYLNINGLGSIPCYYTASSKITTQYAVGVPILLTYRTYDGAGRWMRADYDSNTDTLVRVYRQTTGYNDDYPIIVSRTKTIGTEGTDASYTAVYGVVHDTTQQPTVNPSTGEVKAAKFTGDVAWSNISSTPTTLVGYGITDGINEIATSGAGNAVTGASISGHVLTIAKENTFVDLTSAQIITGAKKLKNVALLNIPSSAPDVADIEAGKLYLYVGTGDYSETPSGGGGSATVYDLTLRKNQAIIGTYNLGTAAADVNIPIAWTDLTEDVNHQFVTATNKANWKDAYDKRHTHDNKTVLDGISSTKVSNWDTAYGWGDHSQAGYLTSTSLDDYVNDLEQTSGNYVTSITKSGKKITVTRATLPTTIDLANVNNADDLKAIEALTGTSGYLKKTAANTWALDTTIAAAAYKAVDSSISSTTSTNLPTSAAVAAYVSSALTSVLKYKGTIGTGGTVTTLPANHQVGDCYVVKTAGTYAGKACEVGDYIICNTTSSTASDSDWDVVNGENQVENKNASLANAGSSVTIATVDGTDLTITTPSTWTGVAKTGTITKVGNTTSGKVTVSSANNTASFGSAVTVGSVGGIDLKFTMPSIYALTIKNSAGTTQLTYNPSTSTDNSITLTKAMVGLSNVENTALSTWTGSSNITTLGTITTGTWNGTKIANAYLVNNSVTVGNATIALGGSATLTQIGVPTWAQASSKPSYTPAEIFGSSSIGDSTTPVYYNGTTLTTTTLANKYVTLDTEQTISGEKYFSTKLAIPTTAPTSPITGRHYLYFDLSGNYSETPSGGGGSATIYDLIYQKNGTTISTINLGTAQGTINVTISRSDVEDTTHKLATTDQITNWNTAYNNNHTHSNKSVLDGISSTNVTNWGTAYTRTDVQDNSYLMYDGGGHLMVDWQAMEQEVESYLSLGDASLKDYTANVTSGSGDLVTSGAVYSALQNYALASSVPTKVSDLTNDSGFISASYADGQDAVIAEGIASISARIASIEDWFRNPSLDEITADRFNGKLSFSNVVDAPDLTAIEALTGTSGLLKKTAANTWSLVAANLDNIADGSTRKLANYLPLAGNAVASKITGNVVLGNNVFLQGVHTNGTAVRELIGLDNNNIVTVGCSTNQLRLITSSVDIKHNKNGTLYSVYDESNLSLATLAGSSAVGSSTQPVYYTGSALAACNLSTTYAPYNANGYVPTTRKVNNKALSSDITLSLDDVADGSTRKLANYLPLAGGTMTGAIVPNSANAIDFGTSTYYWKGVYAGTLYGTLDDLTYLTNHALNIDNAAVKGVNFHYANAGTKPTGSQDGSAFTLAWSSAWVTQMYGDWRTNKFYTRVKTNGTWGDWAELATTKGTVEGLNTSTESDATFTYRAVPSVAVGDVARVTKVKGKTIVWNQQVLATSKTVTVAGGGGNTASLTDGYNLGAGHKYYIRATQTAVSTINRNTFYFVDVNNTRQYESTASNYNTAAGTRSWYVTNTLSLPSQLRLWTDSPNTSITYDNIVCFDLTLMGLDTLTAAEFEALFPLDYYAYNTGELISNKTESIETVGFNLWDEDTMFLGVSGVTRTTDGWAGTCVQFVNNGFHYWDNTINYTGQMCIYMKGTSASSGANFRFTFVYTDGTSLNGPYLSGTSVDEYVVSTSGKTVAYIQANYGSGRNLVLQKLCLSFYDASRNGQYEPYEKDTLPLNLTKLKVDTTNLWDEQWEQGTLDTNGADYASTINIRNKGYIPVEGGKTYYVKGNIQVYEYGASKNYITRTFLNSGTITLNVNTCYLRWRSADNYTYTEGDIWINTPTKRPPLKLNQMFENGDFSNGTTGWGYYNSSISAQNGALSVQVTQVNGGFTTTSDKNPTLIGGHKYFIQYAFNSPSATSTFVYFNGNSFIAGKNVKAGYNVYAGIGTISTTATGTVIARFNATGTYTVYSIVLIDLTKMYGQGLEPTDTEIVSERIGLYRPYTTGEYMPYYAFPKGMRCADYACSVCDEVIGKQAIVKVGAVDLGLMTWTRDSSGIFYTGSVPGSVSRTSGTTHMILPKYNQKNASSSIGGASSNGDYCQAGARIAIYDTGYSDAVSFQRSLNSVKLYFELSTPIFYDLETAVPELIECDVLGTQRRLPEDTASSVQAPFHCDFQYGANPGEIVSDSSYRYLPLAGGTVTGILEAKGELVIPDHAPYQPEPNKHYIWCDTSGSYAEIPQAS